jgi:uncharacterized repeat protein (TIGR02543 family)
MADYYSNTTNNAIGKDSAPWSFADSQITTLVISTSITRIGQAAFYGLANLNSVTFTPDISSSEVKTIGPFAFAFCAAEYVLPPSSETGSATGSATGIATVGVSATVTEVGKYAFFGDNNLSVPNLENTATSSIGEYAFGYCQGNATNAITIPATVKHVGELAFGHSLNLQSVSVASGNTSFIDDGGVLFNRSKDTLIYFPPKKTVSGSAYEIPGTVKAIGVGAFEKSSLTAVAIPTDVTSIGAWAFADCPLAKIAIPATVATIGYYAFAHSLGANDTVFNRRIEPQDIGEDVFFGDPISSIPLVVPQKAAENYRTANVWEDFRPQIGVVYLLEVKVNDASMGSVTGTPSGLYNNNILVSLTAKPNTGYEFLSWTSSLSNPSGTVDYSFTLESDVTVTAKFKLKQFTITYYLDNGTNDNGNPNSYTIKDDDIILKAPTKNNYTFVGWYSEENYTTKVDTIFTSDVVNKTLYAKWKQNIRISGLTVAPKTYDGTTTATVTAVTATPTGGGDSFTLDANHYSWTTVPVFDLATASNGGRSVAGAITLTEAGKALYVLENSQYTQTGLSIAKKDVSISGITATKVYDGTTDFYKVNMSGGSLSGVIDADKANVTIDNSSAKAVSSSKDVGSYSTTTVTGFALSGNDASANYNLTSQPAISASITAKSISIAGGTVTTKPYNGNTDATVTELTFNGLVNSESLTTTDYTIGGATFNDATAGDNKPVTVTNVTLVNNDKTKNYTLSNGSSYNNSETLKGNITKLVPATEHLSYTSPANLTYDGTSRRIGTVTAKTPYTGMMGTIIVYYTGTDGTSYTKNTTAPTDVGKYTVSVDIAGGTNFTSGTVVLGSYYIGKLTPAKEHLSYTLPDGLTYSSLPQGIETVTAKGTYTGMGTIKVSYKSVDGTSYEKSTNAPTNAGSYTVLVDIVAGANFIAASDIELGTYSIGKLTPTKEHLSYTLPNGLTYSGSPQGFTAAVTAKYPYTGTGDITTVHYEGTTGTSYTNTNAPTNAGSYTVSVDIAEGENFSAASNIVLGSYSIGKLTPTAAHLSYTLPGSLTYNGTSRGIGTVTEKDLYTGMMGTIKVYYTGTGGTSYTKNTTAPTDVGTYTVSVDITEGTNFTVASNIVLGSYYIGKLTPAKEHLLYTLPDELTYNGSPQGLTGTVAEASSFTGMGAITVSYKSTYGNRYQNATAPTDTGTYTVTVSIADDGNNFSASSGSITLTTTESGRTYYTIKPKEINIESAFIAEKTYDGTTKVTVDSVTFEGLVAGQSLKLNEDYTVSGEQFLDANAGTNRTVKMDVALAGTAKANNYTLTGGQNYQLTNQTIHKAVPDTSHLTFERNSSVTYDGLAHPFSVSLKSEYTQMGDITVLYNGRNVAPDSARKYAIKVNIVEGDNFTSATALLVDTFTIHKAAPTKDHLAFAHDSSVVYNGQPRGIPVTLKSGYTGMDNIKTLYGGSENLPQDVGKYAVTVVLTGNVNFSDANLLLDTLTIKPDTLAIGSVVLASKTYDGADSATVTGVTFTPGVADNSGEVSSFVWGTDYKVDRAFFADVSAGDTTVKVYVSLIKDNSTAKNYVLRPADSVYVLQDQRIEPKPLTLTGITATKTYDGIPSFIPDSIDIQQVEYVGRLAADAGSDRLALSKDAAQGAFVTANVQEGEILFGGFALTGAASKNYTLTQPTVAASITPKKITIDTFFIAPRIYGDKKEGGTARDATVDSVGFAGLVAGDTLELGVDYRVDSAFYTKLDAGDQDVDIYVSLNIQPKTEPQAQAGQSFSGFAEPLPQEESEEEGEIGPSEKASNYELVKGPGGSDHYSQKAAIAKRPATITGLSATKEYDGSESFSFNNMSGSYNIEGKLSGDDLRACGGICYTASAAVGEYSNVQGQGFEFCGADKDNYVLAAQPILVEARITNAMLTVTPNGGQTKVYGEDDPPLTFTISGWKKHETSEDSASIIKGSLIREEGNTVGTYSYKIGSLSATNYDVKLATPAAVFTITPAPLTVTADGGQQKVYGKSDPTLTFTTSGWQYNDSQNSTSIITGALSRDTTAAPIPDTVGTYAITQGTLAAGINYEVKFVPDTFFTITPAVLTVTANGGQQKVYGKSDPTLTITTSGWQYNDLENSTNIITGALSRDTTAALIPDTVGTYEIRQGTLAAGINYKVEFVPDTFFTITPAVLTVTANGGQQKVYGKSDPTLTFTTSGWQYEDYIDSAAIITGVLSREPGDTVSTYKILNVGDTAVAAGKNYKVKFIPDTFFTITPAVLTVTADGGQQKVYGADDPTLTFTTSGWQYDDFEDSTNIITGALSRDTTAAPIPDTVGTYEIRQGTLAAGINYSIAFVPNTLFTITPAPLKVTADGGQQKVYGDKDTTLTFTTYGWKYPEDSAKFISGVLIRDTAVVGNDTVGTYAIRQGTLAAGINYEVKFVDDTFFTITPAPLKVRADGGQTKVYGENDPTLTFTTNGWQYSDYIDSAAIITGALSRDTTAALFPDTVGTYAITQGTLAAGKNYEVKFVDDTLFTITPAVLEITGITATKTYDGDSSFIPDSIDIQHIEYVGRLYADASSDRLALSKDTAQGAFATANVQKGEILFGGFALTGAASKNYTLTQPTVAASITPKKITIDTFFVAPRIYGDTKTSGRAKDAEVDSVWFKGLVEGETLERDVDYVVDSAIYTSLTAGESDVNIYVSLNIQPEPEPQAQAQEGFPGFMPQEESEEEGEIPPSAKASNYELVKGSGGLSHSQKSTIGKRTLTITGLSASKVYDGTNQFVATHMSGGSLVNTMNGDEVEFYNGNATPEGVVNVGEYNSVQGVGFGLIGAHSYNYTLAQPTFTATITPAVLTVTPDDGQQKVYGDEDPTFTYTSSGWKIDDEGKGYLIGKLSRAGGENVSTYSITQGALSSSSKNYTINFIPDVKFSIVPATLTITGATIVDKTYDGTCDAVVKEVTFTGYKRNDGFNINSDYSATGCFLNNNAGSGKTAVITVERVNTSEKAKNYTLESPRFDLVNQTIAKAVPSYTHFSFSPKEVAYTGGEQCISIDNFGEKYPYSGMGAIIGSVYYGQTTDCPVDVGTYPVYVEVEEGENFHASNGAFYVGDFHIKYTVTFKTSKDNKFTQLVAKGDTVVRPAYPTKIDHRFGGWYRDSAYATPWNFPTDKIYSDTTLYAKWFHEDTTIYTVTFSSKGGTSIDSQLVAKSDTVARPVDPTKDDHRFAGWYSDTTFMTLWNFPTDTLSRDTTLYARWIHDSLSYYVVTFADNGGSRVDRQMVVKGDTVVCPATPERDGHKFYGWHSDARLTARWNFSTLLANDTTLYAKWLVDTASIYNVIFDSRGGSAIDLQEVATGTTVTRPDDPSLPEHTFVGWYGDPDLTALWNFSTDTVGNDMYLYAKWFSEDVITHKMTFESNGGSGVDPQIVQEGDTVARPANPTKNDSIFGGWYKSADFATPWNFPTDTMVGDTTLYAKWFDEKDTTYTVAFAVAGGSRIDPQIVLKGDTVARPVNPTHSDSIFGSWYSDADFATPWNFPTDRIFDNATLHAKWFGENDSHLVTFDSDGGSRVDHQRVAAGDKAPRPGDPTRGSDTFGGWYKDRSFTKLWNFPTDVVIQPITLYARWFPEGVTTYSVTFESNAGTSVDRQVVAAGGTVVRPDDPTKDSYTFVGWYGDPDLTALWNFPTDTVGGDMYLYAKWFDEKDTTYTVTFAVAGGSRIDYQIVLKGDTVARPVNPTHSDSIFGSWYSDANFATPWNFPTDRVFDNITLYAKWFGEDDSHLVAFDSHGGSHVDHQRVAAGDKVPRPANPERGEDTFGGWYSDRSLTKLWNFPTDVVQRPITLHARWFGKDATTYSVTFESNGGSSVDRQIVAEGDTIVRPGNPTKVGYTFGGWYSNSGLTALWNFPTYTVAQNMTLYAKWFNNDLRTVTFDTKGGSAIDPQIVIIGDTVASPPIPTKANSIFGGWYRDGDYATPWNIPTDKVFDHITLHVKWFGEHDTIYTVTFAVAGGSRVDPQTVLKGDTVAHPVNPTKNGFKFGGWYGDSRYATPWNFPTDRVLGDRVLYAKWFHQDTVTYTVTFDSREGAPIDDQIVARGDTVARPANPAKSGSKFGGWYANSTFTALWNFPTARVFGDITLYAKWFGANVPTYTVTFDSRGGTRVDAQILALGDTVIRPTDPTQQDSIFGAWYGNSDLTELWNFSTAVGADTTLYAGWGLTNLTLDSIVINGIAYPVESDTIDYIAPCGSDVQKIAVSFTLPSGAYSASGDTSIVVSTPISLLLDTAITLFSMRDPRQSQVYRIRLEKRFEFSFIVKDQFSGRLLMLVKNPELNGNFHFEEALWQRKIGERWISDDYVSRFYYTRQFGEVITDTLRVMLYDITGTVFETCPYIPNLTLQRDESQGVIYPNPVSAGEKVFLKEEGLIDEQGRRLYETYRLFSGMGVEMSSGQASDLINGLIMPTIPGFYVLTLEGEAGKAEFKVTVVQ